MIFSIAHLTSNDLVNITTFSPDGPATQMGCGLDQLFQHSFQAVTIAPNSDRQPEISAWIEAHRAEIPVDIECIFKGQIEELKSMEYGKARQLLETLQSGWVVTNNIKQIRSTFSTSKELKNLWQNHRDKCAQLLWKIIRNNMATTSLTIIYHDLLPKGEKKRDKLMLVSASGEKTPKIEPTDQWGTLLMENYAKSFDQHFFVTEYNRDRGEMVICASIDRSPVVVMLKSDQVTPLSKAVIETIFTGMQSEI
jgi:hypothetical protein